jgi:hypothetical protein
MARRPEPGCDCGENGARWSPLVTTIQSRGDVGAGASTWRQVLARAAYHRASREEGLDMGRRTPSPDAIVVRTERDGPLYSPLSRVGATAVAGLPPGGRSSPGRCAAEPVVTQDSTWPAPRAPMRLR